MTTSTSPLWLPTLERPTDYILQYDESFAGFLTCVFTAYEQKLVRVSQPNRPVNVRIVKDSITDLDLFAPTQQIVTDEAKAARVLVRLDSCIGQTGISQLIRAFLSEDPDIERCLLGVINHALAHPNQSVLTDYGHADVLLLSKWLKKIRREYHRMKAFVRFEEMQGGIYFARVDPDFNVLPLIQSHFEGRYQDQKWAIYDLRRHYGIYYDLETIETIVEVDEDVLNNPSEQFSDAEKHYQQLWQGYFKHTNIKERRNQKLHRQHVPRRYWKYLTEKI